MKLWFNLANKLANTVNKLGNKHSKRTRQRKHSEQSKVFGSIWVEVQFCFFIKKVQLITALLCLDQFITFT